MGRERHLVAAARSGDLVGAALRQVAGADPRRPALADVNGRSWSYGELILAIDRVARQVRELGLSSTDRVGVVAPNGPNTVAVILGVLSAANVAPIDPGLGPAEILPSTERVGAACVIRPDTTPDGAIGTFEVLSRYQADSERAREHMLLLPTPGTTGEPKIVPLSTRNLLSAAQALSDATALTGDDRYLSVMPLYHIHGIITCIASLLRGGTVLATPGLHPTEFFGWMERFRPTWYSASPTVHHTVVARAASTGVRPRSSLRFVRSQSAPLPERVASLLRDLFAAPVLNSYGMTEAAGQIASQRFSDPPVAGTVGRGAGCDVAILDEHGSPVAPGETGQIAIRGPNVFSGYDGMRADSVDWFLTGDLGRVDAESNLSITGRIRELINRGGEKVSPVEVDEAMLSHPRVTAAAAFAIPDPRLGEDIAAAVVSDGPVSDLELQAWVGGRLASHKVPRWILSVQALPTIGVGKVDRKGLARQLAPELDELRRRLEYSPAVPRVENEIAQMVSELLDVERVGRNESFFDLGGDSFLATRLVEQINARFALDLPVAAAYRAPTIAGFARLVVAGGSASENGNHEDDLIVTLRGGQGRPSFFLIPGVGFSISPYQPLISLLPPGCPVYGFAIHVERLGADPLRTLVTLLARSISAADADAAVLVGYSSAGVIAAHVAGELAGLRVANPKLVLVDSFAPAMLGKIRWHARVLHHWHAAQLKHENFAAYVLRRLRRRARYAADRLHERLRGGTALLVEATLRRHVRAFALPPVTVPTLLLQGCHDHEMFNVPALGWSGSTSGLEVQAIAARHTEIFTTVAGDVSDRIIEWLGRV
jgi:acyl-CoA synthetase (AMP-forming)/AMP-acid ligase II/thioesterase domain-containing protein/acyl carrier protein